MYYSEKKSIQKSVRMTESVFQTVNEFEGDGFNEKFENLVDFCRFRSKAIQGDIDYLYTRKQQLSAELDNLEEAERVIKSTMFELVGVEDTLKKLRQRLDALPLLESDTT